MAHTQIYKESYGISNDRITNSFKGEIYAHCKTFNHHFKICHSGMYDVTLHLATQMHKNAEQSTKTCVNITTMLVKKDLATIRAECHMAAFLIEHNISLKTADHMSDLMKSMLILQ